MALKVGQKSADGGGIVLKDMFVIKPDEPLPDMDSPPALAYNTVHKRDPKRKVFTLICDPKLPPRIDAVSALHRVDHKNTIRVIDWGVVFWPKEGRYCPAIVVEMPAGKRLFQSIEDRVQPMSEDRLSQSVILPLAQAIREIHGQGLTHRAIRPDNLFWFDTTESEVILGECVSVPAAVNNPIAYETIPCSMASPAGRGIGDPSNDMYALGATLLALLMGHSPGVGRSDDDIIQAKLTYGSYSALAQNARLSLNMMEPLRGLLNDDPKERWGLEQLGMWINGRRLSPKQQVMPAKASRAFHFAGRDYLTARELSYGLWEHWDQAAQVIKDGSLDTWLRRSLSDEHKVEAVNVAKGGLMDDDDKLIARVLIALDPEGPIRLRDFSVTAEGLGSILGVYPNEQSVRQGFKTALSYGLLPFWLEQQSKPSVELVKMLTRYERVKTVLAQQTYGAGIERVIYDFNPFVPCLSPMFEKDYVGSLELLLPAIDRYCEEQGDDVRRLVDREVAAYIDVHFRRNISAEMRRLSDESDEFVNPVAQIRLLAALQESVHKRQPFPNIARAALKILDAAVQRFHSRTARELIAKKMRKASKSGLLVDLLAVVDDSTELDVDNKMFRNAVHDYAKTVREINSIRRDIRNKTTISQVMGGQIASALSGIISAMTALVIFAIQWF